MPERQYEVHGSVEVPEGGWINRYERSGDVWFRVTDLERYVVRPETHFVLYHAEKLQTALTLATQQKTESERAKETAMDFAKFEAVSSLALLEKLKAVEAERGALRKACSSFVEWLEREDAGSGIQADERGTPEGEAKFLAWYHGNLYLCKAAVESARAALEVQP